MLSREHVLPELRAECNELKKAFEKAEPVASFVDPDLSLPFSAQDAALAAKELREMGGKKNHFLDLIFSRRYAAWRKMAHEALENKTDFEAVKQIFRSRFLEAICFPPFPLHPLLVLKRFFFFKQATKDNPERRLLVASAYYSVSAESSTNAFAFVCCFREMLRIKADAVEKDVSLSIPSKNFKTTTNMD